MARLPHYSKHRQRNPPQAIQARFCSPRVHTCRETHMLLGRETV